MQSFCTDSDSAERRCHATRSTRTLSRFIGEADRSCMTFILFDAIVLPLSFIIFFSRVKQRQSNTLLTSLEIEGSHHLFSSASDIVPIYFPPCTIGLLGNQHVTHCSPSCSCHGRERHIRIHHLTGAFTDPPWALR